VKGGYTPDLPSGAGWRPVRLQFYRDENRGLLGARPVEDSHRCRAPRRFKTTAVEFTPEEAGEFRFRCGMNMLKRLLVVEPATADRGRRPRLSALLGPLGGATVAGRRMGFNADDAAGRRAGSNHEESFHMFIQQRKRNSPAYLGCELDAVV